MKDYNQILQEQNPWHLTGTVPDAWAMQVERPLARMLPGRIRADEPRRFQLVLGSRRVGKTTAMYQTVKQLLAQGIEAERLWWLRLDHPLLMEFPLGDLVKIIMPWDRRDLKKPIFLFLDELTYAVNWDLWLKTFYDERWPVVAVHRVG